MANVFVRCEPDDPSRCQAVGKAGQCPFRAVGSRENGDAPWDGPKTCPRHGAMRATLGASKTGHKSYLAALWKEKIGRQAENPEIKSLREEIAVLRMMADEKLSALSNRQELLMHSGQITEMMREIGKLAGTAHKIEKDQGKMLDQTQAEAWVQKLVEIIGIYITDEDLLVACSEDMIASLAEFTSC